VPADDLFTRAEVLGGLPAGRARTLLFLIESRTAHLVARSRQAMELAVGDVAARERDLAFLEAFTLGREPPLRPSIQDLERYAPQWADLVPANPRLCAALAHLLGEKYTFTRQAVPGIRAVLGLDTEPVQRAYRHLYANPIASIFAPQLTPLQRLRWTVAALSHWLEALPPFWTAFSLMLTETVGAGILALPIAVASVGPLPGIILLCVVGLTTLLTLTALTEAFARSGPVRYGDAYFGGLVTDYLGKAASFLPTAALALLAALALVALYVGVSTTLAGMFGLPPVAGTALLFLAGLFLLTRPSLHATASSALMIGASSILLILLMALLALPHLQQSDLFYVNVPFVHGQPFRPALLGLIFGVMLAAYFGHLSVGNCASIVLRQDPSARSLIWGGIAAQLATAVLYAIWVFAVNGAVPHQRLAGAAGTALVPLAEVAGLGVNVLGLFFAVLAMGMGSVHMSYALRNLMREWVPVRSRPLVTLPRLQGRLLLRLNGGSLGLSYLGLDDGRPRFRLETQRGSHTQHLDTTVEGHCDVPALARLLPALRLSRTDVAFDVLDAAEEYVRLRVSTPQPPVYEGDWTAAGAHLGDLLELPEPQRRLVQWMMRRGPATLAEVAAHTGQSEQAARATLDALVQQGALQELRGDGARRYRARLARRAGRHLPARIWQALGQEPEAPAQVQGRSYGAGIRAAWRRVGTTLTTDRGRLVLSLSPVVLVFLVTEWLLLHGAASFAGALSFIGVVTVSVLGGLYPMLLLVASRRKGAYSPGLVFRLLGSPPVAATIYLLFLANLVVHGLIIWHDPLERLSALLVAVLVVGVTVAAIRSGAFAPRVVVELREDPGAPAGAIFAVTASGRPLAIAVTLGYTDAEQRCRSAHGDIPALATLRYATFELPAHVARQLEVWAHRVSASGESTALPAVAQVHDGVQPQRYDVRLSGGRVIVPLSGGVCSLRIEMAAAQPRA
jgi:amino acid permease